MATWEKASDERISQFDSVLLPKVFVPLGIDAVHFAKEMEEEERKERGKRQKGFNSKMCSEAKRLKTSGTCE